MIPCIFFGIKAKWSIAAVFFIWKLASMVYTVRLLFTVERDCCSPIRQHLTRRRWRISLAYRAPWFATLRIMGQSASALLPARRRGRFSYWAWIRALGHVVGRILELERSLDMSRRPRDMYGLSVGHGITLARFRDGPSAFQRHRDTLIKQKWNDKLFKSEIIHFSKV